MKLFLDIGGFDGRSIKPALEARYQFDRIYSFEPVKSNYEVIKSKYKHNTKVIVNNFGLLDETCEKPIYFAGSVGGSVFKEKNQGKKSAEDFWTEMCFFVRASEWFVEHITQNDIVFVKINAEGSEILIINDLLYTKEYDKIDYLLVDFDIRKVPGKEYLQQETITNLKEHGKDNYMLHTKSGKVQGWLKKVHGF